MIGVRVGEEQSIEWRKICDGDAWLTHPREKPSQSSAKMWVGKKTGPSKLNQERRVTDVCHA